MNRLPTECQRGPILILWSAAGCLFWSLNFSNHLTFIVSCFFLENPTGGWFFFTIWLGPTSPRWVLEDGWISFVGTVAVVVALLQTCVLSMRNVELLFQLLLENLSFKFTNLSYNNCFVFFIANSTMVIHPLIQKKMGCCVSKKKCWRNKFFRHDKSILPVIMMHVVLELQLSNF